MSSARATLCLMALISATARLGGQTSAAPPLRGSDSTMERDSACRAPSPTPPDAIASAVRDYETSGVARPVIEGEFLTFPYGHGQPTLTCSVLRACIIELEPGEILLSRIAGDTERWEIGTAAAGPDGRTTLVVVKPRDCDVTTNLVLATDRRIYDLTLDAPACRPRSTNPETAYVRHVRFYYPDQTVVEEASRDHAALGRIAGDVLSLNFAYRVRRDRKFPWAPAEVFDDGVRVYIKLPDGARHGLAPALFELDANGTTTLLNYNLLGGDTYVTDRLFSRAVLVVDVGGKGRRVVIERTDPGPGKALVGGGS